MQDTEFTTLLERLKEKGFYVMRTDDGDRYLREVFANDEMVCIATSENEAYMKLGEFVENNLSN